MIATAQALSAAFSRRARLVALAMALALGMLGACAVERETTIARAARSRQVGAQRAERLRLEQQLALLQQTVGQTEAEIAAATRRSVEVAAELRTVLAQLQYEVGLLQRAEADLAAARTRAQQIETELGPLRAVEQTLRDQEALRTAAAARLQALQRQLAAQQQLAAAVTAAEAAVQAALAPLLPPAPAAAPSAVPK